MRRHGNGRTTHDIVDVFGPSGLEEDDCQTLQRIIEPYVDEMRVDTLGNQIATRRGTGNTTLMLDAHMTEIGFIVTFIEDGGFLRFTQTSGWDPRIVPTHAVTIQTDHRTTEKRYIDMPPPHILRPRIATSQTNSKTCSSTAAQPVSRKWPDAASGSAHRW